MFIFLLRIALWDARLGMAKTCANRIVYAKTGQPNSAMLRELFCLRQAMLHPCPKNHGMSVKHTCAPPTPRQ